MSDRPGAIASAVAPEDSAVHRWVTPPRAHPLLSFDGVWRYWGRGSRRWAVLRDINLQLAPGTAVGISGRNGAGKTTLLRIATGMLAPDRGSVTIGNLTAGTGWREYHRRLGFLSAGDRGLYARMTVRGHLEYCARLSFVPRADRATAIAEAIERWGLNGRADRRADRLSQGQRQRLRLALALVHRPAVLMLDEPSTSLDAEGRETLAGAVDAVLVRGGAVIWCFPAGDAPTFPLDRRFVIEDGRLASG